ncbi:MAG: hypothetical protein QNJ04_06715 [Desulfobacterales bacterium]|nr:hypothetical protein [Desulfobacterales bacterium]
MVDRLRPLERVPTVNSPSRVHRTRRERDRQNRRDPQSEEKHHDHSTDRREKHDPDTSGTGDKEKRPAPGQRINVVI